MVICLSRKRKGNERTLESFKGTFPPDPNDVDFTVTSKNGVSWVRHRDVDWSVAMLTDKTGLRFEIYNGYALVVDGDVNIVASVFLLPISTHIRLMRESKARKNRSVVGVE